MTNGRGAWSRTGKDNDTAAYAYVVGKPLDGATPSKSNAYQAVNLGVKAIQTQLNELGITPALTVDGHYGSQTAASISAFQKANGLLTDGRAGPRTCALLWHSLIVGATQTRPEVPANLLYGQMMHESTGDPGACGYAHEPDRGLLQINTEIEPVSLLQAHDPVYTFDYGANRLSVALAQYGGKGTDLQTQCAILAHNSPAAANALFRTGTYANPINRNYVNAVLAAADDWTA